MIRPLNLVLPLRVLELDHLLHVDDRRYACCAMSFILLNYSFLDLRRLSTLTVERSVVVL